MRGSGERCGLCFPQKIGIEGTSSGFSIIYNIVKSHKGTIEAQSTQGQGTTFVVRLPVP